MSGNAATEAILNAIRDLCRLSICCDSMEFPVIKNPISGTLLKFL